MTKLWSFKVGHFWGFRKTLHPSKSDLWRHLGHLSENQVFLTGYLSEEMVLERERTDFRKISMDLFWRRKERRIQKFGFRDLKINTTSGMTSSMMNLGKLGEVHKLGLFSGSNEENGKLLCYQDRQLNGNSEKLNLNNWKLIEKPN